MSGNDQSVTIEGFVTDNAFVNTSKNINDIYVDDGINVGALTIKALSYFNKPAVFDDKRSPASRTVNWPAVSSPHLVIDETVFPMFVSTINGLSNSAPAGFFKLIDLLLFYYQPTASHAAKEASLLADADIAAIYQPGSFAQSTTLLTDAVYITNGASLQVTVPSYITFSITLPTGSTQTTFALKLYTSVAAWLAQYNYSTIVQVINPLPFSQIFSAPLVTTTANIFATATVTAELNYSTTAALLGSVSVSGVVEYKAIITDGSATTSVPFNLLYKGRAPTQFEIRNAIKTALLGSGVGDAPSWKARIPGVFVSGRFYVIPLYSQTYTKPDQVIFPRIAPLSSYAELTNKIMTPLGYGDVSDYVDVIGVYYNRMTASVIPDLSGTVAISHLSTLIGDYQDYSPTDDQFNYMLPLTQLFARNLNQMLAIDAGAQPPGVYTPNTEGQLTFYIFTMGDYEVCVITSACYADILGSTQ
jgi:hypothetical protein